MRIPTLFILRRRRADAGDTVQRRDCDPAFRLGTMRSWLGCRRHVTTTTSLRAAARGAIANNPDRNSETLRVEQLVASRFNSDTSCRWRLDTSAGDDHRLVSSSPGGNRAVSNSESAVVTPYRSARRFRHAYNCVPVRSPTGSPNGRTRSRSPRWRDGLRVGSGRRHRRRRACRVGAGCSAVLVVRRRRGDPDVGRTPTFELVDDRDERLLARERDVARYDSRSSAGVRGIRPASAVRARAVQSCSSVSSRGSSTSS